MDKYKKEVISDDNYFCCPKCGGELTEEYWGHFNFGDYCQDISMFTCSSCNAVYSGPQCCNDRSSLKFEYMKDKILDEKDENEDTFDDDVCGVLENEYNVFEEDLNLFDNELEPLSFSADKKVSNKTKRKICIGLIAFSVFVGLLFQLFIVSVGIVILEDVTYLDRHPGLYSEGTINVSTGTIVGE